MGNGITILPRCDWTPVKDTIEFVILSNNRITHISADAFLGLEDTEAGMFVCVCVYTFKKSNSSP
jgi:hypothetical protein